MNEEYVTKYYQMQKTCKNDFALGKHNTILRFSKAGDCVWGERDMTNKTNKPRKIKWSKIVYLKCWF